VLLTMFRKTRRHEQRQIDRAVRAQKTGERDHRGRATETYERQVCASPAGTTSALYGSSPTPP
jgi:hypothetical protein